MRIERERLMLAALVVATGCADVARFESQEPGGRLGAWVPDSNATILRTALSQLDDPTLAVVSYPADWRALWTQTWGGLEASPALPAVDFVLSSVVVVGLGKRAGLGYSVTIDSIVVRTVGSVLYATESLPGAHCGASSGFSAPVHMVLAPGHPPITDWRVGTITPDC
jgi:hypothetical protein